MKVNIYHAKTFKDASAALMRALSQGSHSPEVRKILLVPDKLTLSAEAEVLYASERRGTFNTAVFSFTDLCSDFARRTEKGKYLNKQSSVELFARIISENRDALKCFGRAAERAGFAEAIYETVAKLRYCLITPQELKSYAGGGYLGEKTADIAIIYEKYNEYLVNGFYDSSSKLDILFGLCEEKRLKGTHIYLKDYDNFSRQEMRVIKKMILYADSVSVACTLDRDKPQLFKNEIFEGIVASCAELGTEPCLIDCGIRADFVTEKIKNELFSHSFSRAADAGGRVTVKGVPDAFSEAEEAARHICRGVRRGARYKDFTVVAASLEDYRLPLTRAFAAYGIPCYLDENLKLSDHALGRFIAAAARIKTEGLTLSAALAVVKSFFGSPHADEFENYCLKYNIKNFRHPFTEGKYCEDAEEARKCLMSILDAFPLPKIGVLEDFTAAVRGLLAAVRAGERLEELAREEEEEGLTARASMTGQAAGKAEEVLAEAESVLSGYYTTDEEFVRILLAGLRSVSLSSVSMFLDSVFAGEMTTSKHHAVKNLIILGANEGVLPSESKDTGILSENNIRELRRFGINAEPSIAAENAREKFNVYQLLCEPSDSIYISYPLTGCRGQKLRESRLVSDMRKMFVCDTAEEEEIFARGQAELMLCARAGQYLDFRFNEGSEEYKEMNALFYALGGSFCEDSVPAEKTALANRLYTDKIAPSKIETFYDCPYKYFLGSGLRLKRRELPDLMPFDAGTILHAVAEHFVKQVGSLIEEEIAPTAESLLDLALSDGYAKLKNSAGFPVLRARLLAESEKMCRSIFEGIKNSDFEPFLLEHAFTRGGLTGKIDRADRYKGFVRVIDYKTGRTETSYRDIYTGRRLQLFTYLSAVAEQTGLTPAGAYYFPVHNDYTDKEDDSPRLTGYTLADTEAIFAADKGCSGGKSGEIPVSLKTDTKSGEVCASGKKVLTAEEMRTMLRYTDHMIRAAGEEILAGNIKASPYKGACQRCDFSAICEGREKIERDAPTLEKGDFGGV